MIARDIANAYKRVEEMQRKELVKISGEWVEAYVDQGPVKPQPRGLSGLIHQPGSKYPSGRKAPKHLGGRMR